MENQTNDDNQVSLIEVLLGRIKKFKTYFSTCNTDEEFWNKTLPLWNRMEKCLIENKLSIKEPEWLSIESVKGEKTINARDQIQSLTLMQKIMLNSMNFYNTFRLSNIISCKRVMFQIGDDNIISGNFLALSFKVI